MEYPSKEIITISTAVDKAIDFLSMNYKFMHEKMDAQQCKGIYQLNYTLSKNKKELSRLMIKISEDEDARVEAFVKKDANGNPEIDPSGRYTFLDREAALKAYDLNMKKIQEWTPFVCQRNDASDQLPAECLSVLLDVIITE